MISRGTTQISVQHSLHSSLTRKTASTTVKFALATQRRVHDGPVWLAPTASSLNQALHHYYSLSKSFDIEYRDIVIKFPRICKQVSNK
jgi:hypothetical protein